MHPKRKRADTRGQDTGSESDLIERILAGDADQYVVLVRRYRDLLYRYALGMVSDPEVAAELVQAALVEGYSRLDECRDRCRFEAWIFRIARDRCLARLESWMGQSAGGNAVAARAPESAALAAAGEYGELPESLGEAIAMLPEHQREALLLRHVEGRSYDDMAELLDAPAHTLKLRVHRARETLRVLLSVAAATGGRIAFESQSTSPGADVSRASVPVPLSSRSSRAASY